MDDRATAHPWASLLTWLQQVSSVRNDPSMLQCLAFLCCLADWRGVCCRSQYQLTYQQAQDMLEGKPPSTGPRDMPVNPSHHADLQSRLSVFKHLADKLRAARVQVTVVLTFMSKGNKTSYVTAQQLSIAWQRIAYLSLIPILAQQPPSPPALTSPPTTSSGRLACARISYPVLKCLLATHTQSEALRGEHPNGP